MELKKVKNIIMNGLAILIADDEPMILLNTSETLEKFGYNILKAVNGKEALDIALEKLPDLILLDWGMPVMDGMEALIKIKADPATKLIPVIIVTGQMTSAENLAAAMSAGADDLIKKPFRRSDLLDCISSALKLVG